MIYTQKIQDAIYFSVKTHEIYQKQKRKGKDVPYITHPLVVGLILAKAGASEDVVVAGILHDTIEDSVEEKKVTKEMLTERFGEVVGELVSSVSEKNKKTGDWHERKAAALEEIKQFSHDSLLLKSGDVIGNNTELIGDYNREEDATFERFNASKEQIIIHTLLVISTIISAWPENPLISDLRSIASTLQTICAPLFMSKYPAPVIEMKDYSETMDITCPVCGWRGTPEGNVETCDVLMDVDCPICDKKVLIVNFPKA